MTSPVAAMVRAKGWLFDIFAHHQAEQLKINREVQRKQLGLVSQDLPYPGAVQSSNNPTTIHAASGWLKGALLGAAVLAAGGVGTLGLVRLLAPVPAVPAPPPAASQPEVPGPTKPAPLTAYDAIYEEQDPTTGEWKQIKREHLPK